MGLKSALVEAADGVTLPVTCFGVRGASQLAPSIITPAFYDEFTNSAFKTPGSSLLPLSHGYEETAHPHEPCSQTKMHFSF